MVDGSYWGLPLGPSVCAAGPGGDLLRCTLQLADRRHRMSKPCLVVLPREQVVFGCCVPKRATASINKSPHDIPCSTTHAAGGGAPEPIPYGRRIQGLLVKRAQAVGRLRQDVQRGAAVHQASSVGPQPAAPSGEDSMGDRASPRTVPGCLLGCRRSAFWPDLLRPWQRSHFMQLWT